MATRESRRLCKIPKTMEAIQAASVSKARRGRQGQMRDDGVAAVRVPLSAVFVEPWLGARWVLAGMMKVLDASAYTARTRGAKTLWQCHTCAARGLMRCRV